MACQEAMISFSQVPGQVDKDTIIISLGTESNSKSEIKQIGESITSKSFDTADILKCDDYQAFWVRLIGSTLDFGKGKKIGEDAIGGVTLTQVRADEPRLYPFASFDTGKAEPGLWRFPSQAGK